jgi:hypothetical protein
VAAIGTEQLDLFVPQFLPMAIKFALALRAGHPKNFCHGALPPGPNFGSSGFLVDNATWSQNIGSPQSNTKDRKNWITVPRKRRPLRVEIRLFEEGNHGGLPYRTDLWILCGLCVLCGYIFLPSCSSYYYA